MGKGTRRAREWEVKKVFKKKRYDRQAGSQACVPKCFYLLQVLHNLIIILLNTGKQVHTHTGALAYNSYIYIELASISALIHRRFLALLLLQHEIRVQLAVSSYS